MPAEKRLRLNKSKLLLVEGADERQFFKELLIAINLNDSFQIIEMGGKYNLRNKMPELKLAPNFNLVTSMGIIRDADDDASAAFQSIKGTLSKNHLPCPARIQCIEPGKPAVGIYILPGNLAKGMLEDVILQISRDHPAMECVDDYMRCIANKSVFPGNISKARCMAFIAGLPGRARNLGEATEQGYWDMSNPFLDDLKKFILDL